MWRRTKFRRITPAQSRAGMTLTEVMLVLGAVGILLGLMLSAVFRIRENAHRVTCLNNLRELGLAVHNYHHVHHRMPPYASGRNQEIYGGWMVHLLSFLGHAELDAEIKNNSGSRESEGGQLLTAGIWGDAVQAEIFPVLLCPSDPTARPWEKQGVTNYLANWFSFTKDESQGTFSPAASFSDLHDGLSATVLFAEGYNHCDGLPRVALESAHYHNFGITQENKPSDDPSYAPDDYTLFQVQPRSCDKWRSQTPHAALSLLLADGSALALRSTISLTTWKQVLKPRDGRTLESDWWLSVNW